MRQPWTGCGTALVTPFDKRGSIDEAAVRRLARRQIDAGIHFLVPCGTTGESPTLTEDERVRVVELVVQEAGGQVPVLAGAGGYNTREVIHVANRMREAGASGLLSVTPYYNKPTPEGLLAHVSAIADASDCPLVFYNVPGRTGANVTAETQLRLADAVPSLVGTKEASGNLNQIADILAHRPEGFAVYSGDDDLTLPLLALGADGLVSVIANAVPGAVSELVRRGLASDYAGARRLHFQLLDAMRASFFESNPAPVKAVLAEMGLIEERLRLPLVPVSDAVRARVLEAYRPHVRAAAEV